MKLKVFGIEITISFMFCAVLSMVVLCDKTGLVVPMLLAAFIHELGHLFVMKYFNCAPKEIRLIPGSVRIVSPVCHEKHTLIILLFGPLVNLVVFCLVYFSSRALNVDYYIEFALINLVYGLFNLLPFYALDGGSILEEILSGKMGAVKAEKTIKAVTLIGAVLFLLIFILSFIKGNVNFSVFILSLYLILSVFLKL